MSSKASLENTNKFFKMSKNEKQLEKHLENCDQSASALNNIYYLWNEESEMCYHSDDTGKYQLLKHQLENNGLDLIEISVYYTNQEGMAGFDGSAKKI